MAILFYRGYTIVTSATQEEETRKFVPLASLSWEQPEGRRHMHLLSSHRRCLMLETALQAAATEAQLWIDRRFRKQLLSKLAPPVVTSETLRRLLSPTERNE
jgi:hypothetical protein